MIDYDTWQTYFGGDASVIGRVVTIEGRRTEIVGVLPRGFQLATGRGVPRRVDVYTPIGLTDFRNAWQYPTIARVPEGRTFAEVQAGLDVLAEGLKARYPATYPGRLRFTIEPVLDDMVRNTQAALRAAVAAVLLLLAIAFANATSLVVARLRTRERELAIQQALGAARSTLALQVVMESAWLGAAAALAGSVLAAGTIAVIREVIPRTVPRWDQITIGWPLIAYAGALTFAGLLVSGLGLVWKVSRTSVLQAIREGSVQGGRSEGSVSRLVLAGSQMALTVVLAFGCVQLARSATNLRHVDVGFDANVLTLRVPYDRRAQPGQEARARLYQRVRDRVAQVPGVTSVGVVTHIPLSGSTMTDGYEADLSKEPSFAQAANYQGVTPGYFATLKIPFLQGRDFTDEEDAKQAPAIVVDETLVRTVFPGERDVIGRTLRLGWGLPNARIIGVVGHARTIEVGRAVRPQIYSSIGSLFQNVGIVTVRTSGDPMALRSQIEAAIREVGTGRATGQVAMLSDNVTAAMSTLVAVTGLVTFLAVTAAALSAVGLYIVIAFIVHERRRSAAIRTALGATAAQVMWSYIRTGGLVMGGSVLVGVVLSLGAAALFSDLLYGVAPRDPLSLGMAVVVAALISATAMCLPTRKAARADIVSILREA
jgi:putative ABC transport system permease protein